MLQAVEERRSRRSHRLRDRGLMSAGKPSMSGTWRPETTDQQRAQGSHRSRSSAAPARLAPAGGGDIDKVVRGALDDARALEEGGADAVIIENFGDVPLPKRRFRPRPSAAMAVAGSAIRAAIELPIGFHVLRNDGLAALALCAACGGDFHRSTSSPGLWSPTRT